MWVFFFMFFSCPSSSLKVTGNGMWRGSTVFLLGGALPLMAEVWWCICLFHSCLIICRTVPTCQWILSACHCFSWATVSCPFLLLGFQIKQSGFVMFASLYFASCAVIYIFFLTIQNSLATEVKSTNFIFWAFIPVLADLSMTQQLKKVYSVVFLDKLSLKIPSNLTPQKVHQGFTRALLHTTIY